MAEKSLVNDAAEILGVAPLEAAAEDEELVVVLELDDELPQPAITAAAANAGTRPLFQNGINNSPLNARAPDSAP